jgi:restriction system protein
MSVVASGIAAIAAAVGRQTITPKSGTYSTTGNPADLRRSGSDAVAVGLTESAEVRKIDVLDQEVLIQSALTGFARPDQQGQIVRSVAIPWAEIIKGLERDPAFLERIHPRRLEELIAEAYRREGYTDVELTPYSADRGRDVIVSATLPGIGTIKIVDQVKRYKQGNKVTAEEVRALVGVLTRDQDVSKGIVTTTSDFAPGIFKEYKAFLPSRLELKNGAALIEWLKELNSAGR